MRIEISRKHWVIFAVFLAMQVFGIAVMASRTGLVHDGWLQLGLFAVWNNYAGWMVGLGLIFSGCFVDALIVVFMWDVFRHSAHPKRDFVLWLLAVLSGVALWQMVRR
jgi:hypothetical protein